MVEDELRGQESNFGEGIFIRRPALFAREMAAAVNAKVYQNWWLDGWQSRRTGPAGQPGRGDGKFFSGCPRTLAGVSGLPPSRRRRHRGVCHPFGGDGVSLAGVPAGRASRKREDLENGAVYFLCGYWLNKG